MATIVVTLSGCDHVHLTITHGGKAFNLVTTRQELKTALPTEDELVKVVLRNLMTFVKQSGLTNWQDIKTAIEAKEFIIQ